MFHYTVNQRSQWACQQYGHSGGQTMTKAEHNRPIPKLFSNRPSASAVEVFGLLREPIIFFENNM